MYRLKTNPWLHQWKALDYVMTHNTAAIFTDMGSGKTKIMIDCIVNRNFTFVMIIGTKKSCDVWEKEFNIHADIEKFLVKNLSGISTKGKVTAISETILIVNILSSGNIAFRPFKAKLP